MDTALTRADARLQVARGILADLQLLEKWSAFGEPILVGAVSYGLVVAPDIDIETYCDEPKIEDGFQVVLACVRHPRIWKARFSNDLDGPNNGLYWQLSYRHENGQVWKIDMWLIRHDYQGPRSACIVEPMKQSLTDETRQAILEIKERAVLDPTVQCGSIYIYRAVLDHGIRDFDQFKSWLEHNQTAGLTNWMPKI